MKIKKMIILFLLSFIVFNIGVIDGKAISHNLSDIYIEKIELNMKAYSPYSANSSNKNSSNSNNKTSSVSSNENNLSTKKTLSCGSLDYIPSALPYFTNNLYKVVKWLVPIILILMGTIDFVRAVISQDENSMKSSTNRFIRRLIAAVVIFFVLAIVQFIISVVNASGKSDLTECIDCFINDNDECRSGSKITIDEGKGLKNEKSQGSGGSSTHESSSGQTHGGSGGSF